MADFRDDLERERRRFAMPGDAFDRLKQRRARRQRDRRIGAAVVALAVAGSGVGGGIYALRSSGPGPEPGSSPTPSPAPTSTVEPTPSPSPSFSPSPSAGPGSPQGIPPAISSPIQFLDEDHGWRAGENGELLESTDGGRTWTPREFSPRVITGVAFADPDHGWALASDGSLHRTTDGGRTWEFVGGSLQTVQFLSPDLGWGVELDPDHPTGLGLLLKTVDGGDTWTRQSLEVNSVCFSDGGLGWAAGPSEGGVSLFRTEDGGEKWTEKGIGLEGGDAVGYAATVRCDAGVSAWVLAAGGPGAGHIAYAVFVTVEGGPDVRPVLQEPYTHPLGEDQGIPGSTNPYPGPLVAFDGLTADLVTWCPVCGGDLPFVTLEWTASGGAEWFHPTVVGSERPSEPLGISFLDRERGWILLRDMQSQEWAVLRTVDGGSTWEEVSATGR